MGNPRPMSGDVFFNDSHQNAPEALLISIKGVGDGFPLMKLVALSLSVADDRNGLLLVESVVQRVGWKYGEGTSGLAGARDPVVCTGMAPLA